MRLGALSSLRSLRGTPTAWESIEAQRGYGSPAVDAETIGDSRKITLKSGSFFTADSSTLGKWKKSYIQANMPQFTTKCTQAGCFFYNGDDGPYKISDNPTQLVEKAGGGFFADLVSLVSPESAVVNQYIPQKASAPVGGVTFSAGAQNTFDTEKYGMMTDGSGNVIQTGPVNPGESSYDYRYYQQMKNADKIPIIDDIVSAVSDLVNPGRTVESVAQPQTTFRTLDVGPLAPQKTTAIPTPSIQVSVPKQYAAYTPPTNSDWSDVLQMMAASKGAKNPAARGVKKKSSSTPYVIAGVAVIALIAVALLTRKKS